MSVLGGTPLSEAYVRIRAVTAGIHEEVRAEGQRAGSAFAAAFNKGSRGAFGNFHKEASQITRGAAAGSGAFKDLGRSLAFASAGFLGTAKAIDIVHDSITEVISEQKELERTSTLFSGRGSMLVKKFADDAVKSLGLVDDQTLKMSNDLGQMLIPLGVAPEKAAALSVELVKLVGNLSSMRNEDPSQVLNAIEVGLRGRGMALKQYGIVLNDNLLKEEALRQGLIKQTVDTKKVEIARRNVAIAQAILTKEEKKWGENTTQVEKARNTLELAEGKLHKAVAGSIPALTQQQKSLAAVQIILRQSGRYADEFSSHIGSAANQQRILHAEIDKVRDKLGYALLPAFTKVTKATAEWLGVERNQEKIQTAITESVHTLGTGLQVLWTTVKTGVTVIRPFVDALGGIKGTLELILAFKIARWVNASVNGLATTATGWLKVGTAATTAAAETSAATSAIQADIMRLNTSGGITTLRGGVAGIGTAAEQSAAKVTGPKGLLTGLRGLSSIGRIAVPIALITSMTNSSGSTLDQAVQAGLMGFLFGGPEGAIVGLTIPITLKLLREGIFDNPLFGGDRGGDGKVTQIGKVVNAEALRGASRGQAVVYNPSENTLFVVTDIGLVEITVAQAARLLGTSARKIRALAHAVPGFGGGSLPSVTKEPQSHTYANRVSGETAGLEVIQGAVGGSSAINYKGHVTKSYHYSGQALDIGDGGNPTSLIEDWNFLFPLRERFAQLIWAPKDRRVRAKAPGSGHGYAYGIPFDSANASHTDHIHVAFTGSREEAQRLIAWATQHGNAPPSGPTFTGPQTQQAPGPTFTPAQKGIPPGGGGRGGGGPRTYGYAQLKSLWIGAGGDPSVADIAAAIALAESSGRSNAINKNTNGSTDYGCWQINSVHKYDATQLLAPDQRYNARAAVAISGGGSNFSPWVAYKNGAYEKYLQAGTKPLTVGTKPGKTTVTVIGQGLANEFAQAQRNLVQARPKGIAAEEAAIKAEIAIDNRIIAAAEAYLAKHPAAKKKVNEVIKAAKDDIAQLTAELTTLANRRQRLANKAYETASKKMPVINEIIAGFGIPDIKDRGRAVQEITDSLTGMSDTARRAILTAQRRARAQLQRDIKAATAAETGANDAITILLGLDPSTIVTSQDKWGRLVTTTLGAVTTSAQQALRDLKEAVASGNDAAIKAAIAKWNAAKAPISNAIQAAFDAARSAFETAFGNVSSRIDAAFDRQTSATLSAMAQATNDQIASAQASTQAAITALQTQLQTSVAQVQAWQAKLTPAERKLKELQDMRDRVNRALALGDAQMSLTQARAQFSSLAGLGVGAINPLTGQPITQADIQSAADAMVSAMRSTEDAKLAIKEAALQKTAEAERKARDESANAQIAALEKAEAAQEQSLQNQEAALEKSLNEQLAAQQQEYQDARDAQREQLDLALNDWLQKIESGQASYADFVAWLQGQQAPGGLLAGVNLPDPVSGMAAAGQKQGSAFANAFLDEMKKLMEAIAKLQVTIVVNTDGSTTTVTASASTGGGGGPGNCFPPGTLVSTPDGDIPIEGVQVGDSVYTHDFASGDNVETTVVEIFEHDDSEVLLRLSLDRDTVLETTPEHHFWSSGEWLPAARLQPGDVLTDFDGSPRHIRFIETVPCGRLVYNFHVEHGDHNYYAAGVLVHNALKMAGGGEVPGPFTGAYDNVAIRATPGETMLDRTLTNALKAVFLEGDGKGDERVVRLLAALLDESKSQTGLMGGPAAVLHAGESANSATMRAAR